MRRIEFQDFCFVSFLFFAKTEAGYAAEAADLFVLGFSLPVSSHRTLTSFDTPGSCMVTPYNTGAISMVLRLCVTTMNCVWSLISPINLVKRPTFASSSDASTSSRMQNGLG